MYKFLSFIVASTLTMLLLTTDVSAQGNSQVILPADVKWEPLNPARGDNSPKAGTLWGDRQGKVPTGFLVKFADGFSSPPHIHNVTYRAVVISGYIHNDDPDAAPMWMPAGSFWTQPKGEVHITAAKGASNIALVEIDNGPYLVRPAEDAFDSGERPINVESSNVVWVTLPGMPDSEDSPQIAYLWGDFKNGQPNGTFIKLPAGFTGKIHSQGSTFRAVIIKGQPQYLGAEKKLLEPGSYFGSEGDTVHEVSSNKSEETIIYVRTNGRFSVIDSQ